MAKLHIPQELKPFWKLFDQLCHRHDYVKVFSDYIDIVLTQFFLLDDITGKELHAQAIKRYNDKEKSIISQCFNEQLKIWIEMVPADNDFGETKNWYDFFGELYMAISSTSKASALGQFFTPGHICDLMTRMTIDDPKKFKTYNDPTCGSGRTLLSAHAYAGAIDSIYFAEDIDPICVKMTAINFALHGMRSEVICHDSLFELESIRFGYHVNSMAQFRPPMCPVLLPHIIPISSDDSIIIQQAKKFLETKSRGQVIEEKRKEITKKQEAISYQLKLFDL